MIVNVYVVWKKSCMTQMIVYVLSLSKLETVLAQALGRRLNGELQTLNTPQHFAIFHHYIQKC